MSSIGHPVVEVLIRPRDVLGLSQSGGVGDCDDFSMLTAVLRQEGFQRKNASDCPH